MEAFLYRRLIKYLIIVFTVIFSLVKITQYTFQPKITVSSGREMLLSSPASAHGSTTKATVIVEKSWEQKIAGTFLPPAQIIQIILFLLSAVPLLCLLPKQDENLASLRSKNKYIRLHLLRI